MLDSTNDIEIYKGIKVYRFDGDYITNCAKTTLLKEADINCVFGVGHNKEKNIWKPIFEARKPTFIKIGTSGDMINKGIPSEFFRGFNGILCQNNELIDETEKLNIDNLHGLKIKNGLDIKSWQSSLKSKKECRKIYDISNDNFVISAVGRFVIRKNFPLIINSVDYLRKEKKLSNITLLLHGSDFGQHDGEEYKIKKIAQNTDLNIIFVDPKESVGNTLRASDVFITLGTKEGAPNIIIEAMASGLPIIASHISGHDVYVTNNGYLVDFNKKDIALKLYSLYLDKNLRNKFSKNSLKNVKEFDISKTAKLYLDVFKRWW